MKIISYQEYLDALWTIERFHQQVLTKKEDVQKSRQQVDDLRLNAMGTERLLDFFDNHPVPRRFKTSSCWQLGTEIPMEEWTVEFFLDKLLVIVDEYQGLGCIRARSAKTLTELLITFSENGYEEDVEHFDAYFWKDRVR